MEAYIAGHKAFPLVAHILKPYPNTSTVRREKAFNKAFRKARVKVEHSFGSLKGRWRLLCKGLDCNAALAVKAIAACMVFHNILECSKVSFDMAWLDSDEDINHLQTIGVFMQHALHNTEARAAGQESARDTLADYVMSQS